MPYRDTDADEQAFLDALYTDEAEAFVNDKSFVDYLAATNCSFMALPGTFNVWDQALSYSKRVNASFIAAIDKALVQLMDGGVFEQLQVKYISMPAACGAREGMQSQITMAQVGPLCLL